MKRQDYVRNRIEPLKSKGLRKQLSLTIRRQFPRIGGPRMGDLCADIILEVVERHLRPREHLRHGQILWLGFDIDDPPSRGKTTADSHLVPVVLDVCTPDDLEAMLDRKRPSERLAARCIRMSQQAHAQGALLSNVDLGAILHVADSHIAHVLAAYERDNNVVIPRRANVHDVGSGVTHKGIICAKRYREGKTSDVIARETYHSIEAVDRYLGMFDRVRMCRRQGLTEDEIGRVLGCTVRLVREYAAIDEKLDKGAVS
jgi:hypothetical protein